MIFSRVVKFDPLCRRRHPATVATATRANLFCISLSRRATAPTQPPRLHHQLHARSLLGPGARTSTKMQLSGLVFLLLGSAACFDIDIAPPKLGLRRLFRKPYRGSICVIEIVGAELTPIANCATARSLYPVAQPPPQSSSWLRCHFGRAHQTRTRLR